MAFQENIKEVVMEGFDVAGLLDAGYAAPSMAPMNPDGVLSSGVAVQAPMDARGVYGLLGDVPFSVSPGGEVYTPPPVPQFSFPFSFNPFFSPLGIPNFFLSNIGAYGSPFN